MTATTANSTVTPETTRLRSMDAYRGFVMVCLAANGFGLKKASENFPNNSTWQAIGYQFDHVPWVGCAFWDLIQPSFMFLVGVAMPYSYSRREASGESPLKVLWHVLTRSVALIALGIFLSSLGKPTTNFTFMNVLTQIGLGYSFLFLLRNRTFVTQLAVAVLILGAYWAWFAMTPAVPLENLKDYNLPPKWVPLEGFEAHWQRNANPAARFDDRLLNLFPSATPRPATVAVAVPAASDASPTESESPKKEPESPNAIGAALRRLVTRPEAYVFNQGGYQTLNFIPSLVTMLFGLMAGEFIRRSQGRRAKTFAMLLLAGLVLLGLGWFWQFTGTCPLVKRIWTPSWTLFSTGWALLMLATFFGVIDGLGWRAWSFPLIVAGMNSMVLYLCGQMLRGWTADLLKRHVNENLFQTFGSAYAPIVEANLVLLCFWLFVYWLYRQKLFVRL